VCAIVDSEMIIVPTITAAGHMVQHSVAPAADLDH